MPPRLRATIHGMRGLIKTFFVLPRAQRLVKWTLIIARTTLYPLGIARFLGIQTIATTDGAVSKFGFVDVNPTN